MINARLLARTLAQMSTEESSSTNVLDKFFGFVEKYSLQDLLPNVLSELERGQKERYRETALSVSASHPLSPTEESDIVRLTGAKDAPIDFTLEEDLLGGFRARYKGMEYEGSLGSVVNKLEKELQT